MHNDLKYLLVSDDLLLTRQVKQYKFMANGETQVDGVDDANMFGVTEVSHWASATIVNQTEVVCKFSIVAFY